MRLSFLLLMLSSLTFGQTFEVKDQHGILVVTVDIVMLFTHRTILRGTSRHLTPQ